MWCTQPGSVQCRLFWAQCGVITWKMGARHRVCSQSTNYAGKGSTHMFILNGEPVLYTLMVTLKTCLQMAASTTCQMQRVTRTRLKARVMKVQHSRRGRHQHLLRVTSAELKVTSSSLAWVPAIRRVFVRWYGGRNPYLWPSLEVRLISLDILRSRKSQTPRTRTLRWHQRLWRPPSVTCMVSRLVA